MRKTKIPCKIKSLILLMIIIFSLNTIYLTNIDHSESQNDPLFIHESMIIPQSSNWVRNATEFYAILIGVNDYTSENFDQYYSDKDAIETKEFLEETYQIPSRNIFLHIDENASRDSIQSSFNEINSKIDGNDVFLFYFSGRGFFDDISEENFSTLIETPHNYPDSYEETFYLNHSDALGISVHFSLFETEKNNDYVTLGDEEVLNSTLYQETYNGNLTEFWSGYIPGDNLTIKFKSDSYINRSGFVIDKYRIFNKSSTSHGLCMHDFPNNSSEFLNSTSLNDRLDDLVCDKQFIILDSSYSGGMISDLNASDNRLITSATSSYEINHQDESKELSFFTSKILLYWENMIGDSNEDGAVSWEESFLRARSAYFSKPIHPQVFTNLLEYETIIKPQFINWNYTVSDSEINFGAYLSGIHYVQNINLILYSNNTNQFTNYTLLRNSEAGFGNFSGDFFHTNIITSVGITANIVYPSNSTLKLILADSHDSDQDNVTDIDEFLYGANAHSEDSDNDTLSDAFEISIGTHPGKKDTDGDLMPDKWELDFLLNPLDSADNETDHDIDGLYAVWEFLNHTNPRDSDSDDDRMKDGWEVAYRLNPLNPTDNITDNDFDNMINYYEFKNGTDPWNWDTDFDTLSDYWEWGNNTDPNNNDTDTDGLLDGLEITLYNTKPTDDDCDDDILLDGEEIQFGSDPWNNDTDFDGLLDLLELAAGTDPNNQDSDGDRLLDGEEVFIFGTHPLKRDSDGDGYPDNWEVHWGSDPNDPNSKAYGIIYVILISVFIAVAISFVFIRQYIRQSRSWTHTVKNSLMKMKKMIISIFGKLKNSHLNKKVYQIKKHNSANQ
jgi:hypothetical protein